MELMIDAFDTVAAYTRMPKSQGIVGGYVVAWNSK